MELYPDPVNPDAIEFLSHSNRQMACLRQRFNNSIEIENSNVGAIEYFFQKNYPKNNHNFFQKYFAKYLASSKTFRIFAVSSKEDRQLKTTINN